MTVTAFVLVASVLVAGCGKASAPAAQATDASPVAQANSTPAIPGLPPGVRVEFVTPTPDLSPPPPDALKITLQPGSTARYLAQELLLGRSYMSDAVGSTDDVRGTIYLTPEGKLIQSGSMISVDLRSLKSDEAERDSYLKEVTLETDRFPQATFVPQTAIGLPARVTQNTGYVSFRLVGDLTIHGVTKEASWLVTGDVSGNSFTGSAVTTITLQDFGMTPPQVPVVLGVDNTVRLELSFAGVRDVG